MPRYTSRPDDFRLDPSHPLARGLVFAGLGHGRGSGTMRDDSVYRNNGTLTSMSVPATSTSGWTWVPELRRWGLKFDGNDDYVSIPVAKTTGSESFWVYLNSKGSDNSQPTLFDSGASTDRREFGISGSDGLLEFYVSASVGGPGWTKASSGALGIGTWYHVAITHATSATNIYLNGASVYSGAVTYAPYGNVFRFGTRTDAILSPYTLNGKASDILVYSRVLSQPEIKRLADPSNVMLSGMLQGPRRKIFKPAVATATTVGVARRRLARPSYANGFARCAAESENPQLWMGLVGVLPMAFGNTGTPRNILPPYQFAGNGDPTTVQWDADHMTWTAGASTGGLTATIPSPVSDFSIFVTALSTRASGSKCLVTGYSGTNKWSLIHDGTNIMDWQLNAGTGSRWTVKTIASKHSYVLTQPGTDSANATLWQDGGLVTRTGNAGDWYLPTAGGRFKVGTFSEVGAAGSNGWQGSIWIAGVYNRVLPASLASLLSIDPLAPFRLRRRVFAVGGAAPAANRRRRFLSGTYQ